MTEKAMLMGNYEKGNVVDPFIEMMNSSKHIKERINEQLKWETGM